MTCAVSTTVDWSQDVPRLTGQKAGVRELRLDDAASLALMLSTDEVTRFITPPPNTVAGFERFIRRTHLERSEGRCLSFAIVPEALDTAAGIIQVGHIGSTYHTAEWGFAVGSEHWGTGLFIDAARQVMNLVFGTLGVRRLEARSVAANGRGNGALRKLGATCEGTLRGSFLKEGESYDQMIWSILDTDWLSTRLRQ